MKSKKQATYYKPKYQPECVVCGNKTPVPLWLACGKECEKIREAKRMKKNHIAANERNK